MYIRDNLCLEDVIAGDDFLGLCDEKSSYEHFSNFRRSQSYGRLKLRTKVRIIKNNTWNETINKHIT